MTFAEVLLNPVTNLPVKRLESQTFRSCLRELLKEFIETTESSDEFYKIKKSSNNPLGLTRSDLNTLINGINDTVDRYYEGKPAQAYQTLEETLSSSKVGEILWKDGTLPPHTNVFRVRNMNGNFPLRKCDLFHIPFHQRGLVRTQRYSIPGLPSLYLANSIYVAWEEMLRPGINEIQAMRLQNIRSLRFLDLTTDDYNLQSMDDILQFKPKDILHKVFTWPVIAACSMKVDDFTASFKPEYIIPQLLLQWIAKQNLDGIKYSSTHIQVGERQHTGEFYNLVLPVKSFEKDEGYCPVLAGLFRSTQVLPMQLTQLATTTGSFMGQETISTAVNKDIYSLELIKGMEQPYWHTSFGMLEHALKGLDLESVLDVPSLVTLRSTKATP